MANAQRARAKLRVERTSVPPSTAYDEIIGVRGTDVVERWPVAARGR